MQYLTESDVSELQKLAEELSVREMPVSIKYEHPHITVHFKKPAQRGLIDAQHHLLISQHATLDLLKTALKHHVGL